MRIRDPRQLLLFDEIFEVATTRDEPFEDDDGSFGTRIVKPAGRGWRAKAFKFQRERYTQWERAVPVCAGHGGMR